MNREILINRQVKIIECPRDAWQGLAKAIPAEAKAEYLRMLVGAGFRHIDAVSFVSPAAVPQMADSEKVLEYLDAPDEVEIIGIVVNEKGAERAIETGRVQTLGFPYSVSPTFLKRNQNQTPEESLDKLEAIGQRAFQAGLGLVAYVSMAFGNPYGDEWNKEEVIAACDLLADMGVKEISLADTVGIASTIEVEDLLGAVLEDFGDLGIGVHLHARPDEVRQKVAAAYRIGCRRMDMAIAGLGGCPFAQDALVGNIATEIAVAELKRLGAVLPELQPLDALMAAALAMESQFGLAKQ